MEIDEPGTEAAPAPEVATTEAALNGGGGGGHHGPDGETHRAWVCSAGLPGWGPLFYATDCQLDRAMDYAVATCERRMHVDEGECFQQGCTLEYSFERCFN